MRSWASASLTALSGMTALAQTLTPSATQPARHRRVNELTLAGLRPGRDTAARAVQLYKKPNANSASDATQLAWSGTCMKQTLTIDMDSGKKIAVVRTMDADWDLGDCRRVDPGAWRTGRGLRVNDLASRVVQLYGEPDSRSPSTKDGRRLELLYYAFDWAGPDVPQVMQVVCTVEDDGKPGRVVEITLAAPSL
jgi:hypothetical protein